MKLKMIINEVPLSSFKHKSSMIWTEITSILISVVVNINFMRSENQQIGAVLLDALLWYCISSALHLVVHECGHFIGGIISGYELICLQFGLINIVKNKDKKLKLVLKWSLNGQCIMLPKPAECIHFKAYNMGGIYANVIITIFSCIFLVLNSTSMELLLVELTCSGARKIAANAIRYKGGTRRNDGYITKILKKDEEVQKDYVIYLNLYSKLVRNEKINAQEYIYKRKTSQVEEEMLFYNEIQNVLRLLGDK